MAMVRMVRCKGTVRACKVEWVRLDVSRWCVFVCEVEWVWMWVDVAPVHRDGSEKLRVEPPTADGEING